MTFLRWDVPTDDKTIRIGSIVHARRHNAFVVQQRKSTGSPHIVKGGLHHVPCIVAFGERPPDAVTLDPETS